MVREGKEAESLKSVLLSLGHQSLPPTGLDRVDEEMASPVEGATLSCSRHTYWLLGREVYESRPTSHYDTGQSNGIDISPRGFLVLIVISVSRRTATAGSDVVQSGRPIFDDFFQHLWPNIGNNTANVVFQMAKRLWLIRIDQ
ncbi:hypothetical protein TNCV_4869961 [Trichonephila clavipes]|nr:hypothetical protein TNCV_4869961 [Trichonephila clavipes]